MMTSRNTSSFAKADSRNLSDVNNIMILEYMAISTNHNIAEIRGAKALMSSRDAYLNSAVGYVEVKTRQDRITASKLHEAAYCNVDGTLVQQLLGGYKIPDTAAMKRGCTLDVQVKKEIEKQLNINIEYSGFILRWELTRSKLNSPRCIT